MIAIIPYTESRNQNLLQSVEACHAASAAKFEEENPDAILRPIKSGDSGASHNYDDRKSWWWKQVDNLRRGYGYRRGSGVSPRFICGENSDEKMRTYDEGI